MHEGGGENTHFKLGVNVVQNVNSNLLVMGFGLILVFLLALLISLCNPLYVFTFLFKL